MRDSVSPKTITSSISSSDGLTFLCMANDIFGNIHMRFMKNYGKVALHAQAYAMNDEFSRVLHQQMEYFSSNPNINTLNRVRGAVSEIRSVMVENIEKIMERGDRIELLVDKIRKSKLFTSGNNQSAYAELFG